MERRISALAVVVSTAALAMIATVSVDGQTPARTSPRRPAAPRAAAFNPPRTPDGKPNLQGIWQVFTTAAWDIQDHTARRGVPAGRGVVEGNDIPYQPWAAEKQKKNFETRATADPENRCYLSGVPRITYMPFPFQIFQTPDQVTIAYEYLHALRTLYINGTAHPKGVDFWMGDSRARWDGDTLVVDVTNFTDQTWFDRSGNFHSGALHVVERYTMVGRDQIRYDVTIDDSKVFTRPWKMSMLLYRRNELNLQLLEYECLDFLADRTGEGK